MRLRNKKTGEIFEWEEDRMPYGLGLPHPKSLAELNEEWEDYEPIEPLIKDEEIISFISLLERIDRKVSKLCGEEEE